MKDTYYQYNEFQKIDIEYGYVRLLNKNKDIKLNGKKTQEYLLPIHGELREMKSVSDLKRLLKVNTNKEKDFIEYLEKLVEKGI